MSIPEVFEFFCPTRIIHGIGSVSSRLGVEAKELNGLKTIIVTDPGIVEAGLLEPVRGSLRKAGISCRTFDKIGHDARVGAVDEGAKLCQEEEADLVVAIGGGSALAAGKAVAAIATNGGSLGNHQGSASLLIESLPVIAIPTTAGSGAEVSAAVPYFDERLKRKTGTHSRFFYPKVAILDATLLDSLPVRQAVQSGVDALTHAMESLLTVKSTPITDAMALNAIKLLSSNLRVATNTSDLEAKQRALIGSTMANLACGNAKLGLAHLLNRPINSLFPEVPYGESIGVLLVPVMEYNFSASIDRFAAMADAMGERCEHRSTREFAGQCLTALKHLLAELKVTRRYSVGVVDKTKIPQMARMCAKGMHGGMQAEEIPETTLVKSFNRRQAKVSDVIRLYERAFDGWDV